MCAQIVLAEDDGKQAELVRLYLERDGHSVTVVHDGRSAIDEVRGRRPELLVLDVMLPRVDGLEVCRVLRQECGVAVLMLTARSTEDDLIQGLDQGADDYMTKPFSPRELSARVRSLLRRSGRIDAPSGPLYRAGPIVVDPVRHEVRLNGERVDCTPGEFRLIEAMAAQPGRVFTREQLLEHLHGFDRFITSRTIDAHIKNLRKKIEPSPRSPVHLVTVYGVGYKLTGGRQVPDGTR